MAIQHILVCWIVLLYFSGCVFAQQPRKFYLQLTGTQFHNKPTYSGNNPNGYLHTPRYEYPILGGSGVAAGYAFCDYLGVEVSYQYHRYTSFKDFGQSIVPIILNSNMPIFDGMSWGLRLTTSKHLLLPSIGLRNWYLHGFIGGFWVRPIVPGTSTYLATNGLIYNTLTGTNTLTMETSGDLTKDNFLNAEVGIRLEKVFANRIGIMGTLSHSIGFSPFITEDIYFTHQGVRHQPVQRSQSGTGIYLGMGIRYYFDLPFLFKKTTKNSTNTIEMPKRPVKPRQFMYSIF